MKKIAFILILFVLSACSRITLEASYDTIIPLPQSIKEVEGEGFLLNTDVGVRYDGHNNELQTIVDLLCGYIESATGITLSLHAHGDTRTEKEIVLVVNEEISNPEGYKLSINKHAITIEGSTEAGLFYGVQTLRKSLPALSGYRGNVLFNCVEIEDYPRFAYRGMMFDVSRHFFPLDFLKRYIDIISLHNINKFHFHLTEDQGWRIEIKSYPKLTEVGSQRKETIKGFITGEFDGIPHGGYYTQEELKELVAYAKERYIEIIPEVDLPGHMLAALASYPELGCTGGPYEVSTRWGIFPDVLCPGNEQVYVFLEKVLDEVFDIFPSEYIHIGGDECPKTRWKTCPKCQAKIRELGLKDDAKYSKESKLQSYLTHRLEKFITSRGRKLIGWDEIIEGGLAPNATVMSWRGKEGARFAAQTGHDVIMCPNSDLYFDYYQTENTVTEPEAFPEVNSIDEVYNFNPIPSGLTDEEAKRIIGVQANLFVEQIKEESHVEYMLLPRMAALAELQWTNDEKKDYHMFLNRLQKFISFYHQLNYNFSTAPYEPIGDYIEDYENQEVRLKLSTYDGADIYYTTDNTMPTRKSDLYTAPVTLTGKGKIQAFAYRNNTLIDKNLYVQEYNINKATLKKVELITPISKYFDPPRGVSVLTDGRRGDGCHVFGNPTTWIGFGGRMAVIIDLEKVEDIHTVTTSVLLVPNSKEVTYTVSVSDDGETYKSYYSEPCTFNAIADLEANLEGIKGRYVKIEITSANHAHIVCDEIMIE